MSTLSPLAPLIYPDNSVLSRLSDEAPLAVAEAALIRRIVRSCRSGRLRLLTSVILRGEVENAPEEVRAVAQEVLAAAETEIQLAPILRTVRRLNPLRLPATDALHLAAAVAGGARYAVSCDQHWLRSAAQLAALLGPEPIIVSPIELIRREGLP